MTGQITRGSQQHIIDYKTDQKIPEPEDYAMEAPLHLPTEVTYNINEGGGFAKYYFEDFKC
jgi:hypothetical protein